MHTFETLREQMVQDQLVSRGITDAQVLAAMRAIPRETFITASSPELAYADSSQELGFGQQSTPPYLVALMAQLLELDGEQRVLEIGTGSGYSAAVLGKLARKVYTIEWHAPLALHADLTINKLSRMSHVLVLEGDGSKGLAGLGPYDAILVMAGISNEVFTKLCGQLKRGGRIVAPLCDAASGTQQLVRGRLSRDGTRCVREIVSPVSFTPLIEEHA